MNHKLEKETVSAWNKLTKSKKNKDYINTKKYISARNELAIFYYPIVKKLATLLNKKHGDYPVEDLLSFGAIGLLEAIDRFDPIKNIKFETFATYRIFGSIYDQVRDDSWIPRLSKQRHSITDKIQKKFLTSHGRYPSDGELICEIKKVTDQDPFRVLKEKNLKLTFSIFNSPAEVDNEVDFYQIDKNPGPSRPIVEGDTMDFLKSMGLHDTEISIIYYVYFQKFTLKETSAILEISNSKTCSTHSKIIKKLRKIFINEPSKVEELLTLE
tara:strand:+ start:385 stop:1194 length:810 start_codon:yes stop_codon:yes gene_type:complete